jgi:hypothetical protein
MLLDKMTKIMRNRTLHGSSSSMNMSGPFNTTGMNYPNQGGSPVPGTAPSIHQSIGGQNSP